MDADKNQGLRAAQLVAAYAAARYFVDIGGTQCPLGVGQDAAGIEKELHAASYLFITAWNPASLAASQAENLAAGERLQARIGASGLRHNRALGSDARGDAVEPGWLVLDAPLRTAEAWAREFGQAAVLYWKRGEPVRLHMLLPRPDGSGDQPHTGWAG